MSLEDLADKANHRKVLGKIAELVEKSGINFDDIGRVDKIRLNSYQSITKDEEGEAHVHDLEAMSVVLSPKWAEGPEWPVVQPAKPTVIKPPAAPAKVKTSEWKTAVILPDPQIGFRRQEDGSLDPFHDEKAIAVALKIVHNLQPDVIVNLGDTLDLPEWGKYTKEPSFYFTTQASIDRAHTYLAEQRAAAPGAEIHLIEGNHDYRMTRAILENAMAAFGLRQANAPEAWPVMSIQHLLRLDELDVNYVGGYPAGEVWINDNLVCIHGSKVKSGGSTAAAVVNGEPVSVIFGHVHRLEFQSRTQRTRKGPLKTYAATPGCLSRVDGAVPSVHSGMDAMGRPLQTWENWCQGLGVVTYQEGDGQHSLELIAINDGMAHVRGQVFS